MEMENTYREPEQVSAIIFGHLVKTFGKVTVTNMNKLLVELGYDRVNAKELNELASSLGENPELGTLVDKAVSGEITLEQLENYYTEEKVYETKSLHDVITPYQVEHQRVLADNRAFNKIQREGAFTKILFEDLKADLKKEFANLSKPNYSFVHKVETPDSGIELIVTLADFHIGAVVENSYTNGYNFNILLDRLSQYLQEVEEMASLYNVERIHIYFLGDEIEHLSMRNVNQAFETEFTMSEQISKATRVLADFIQQVEKLAPVTYGMVGGNHGRIQGNKNDKVYNDNAAYIILDTLFLLQEQGLLQRTELIDNRHDVYSFETTVQGKVIKVTHGDNLKGVGSNIPKFIKTHAIDYLITGHVHNMKTIQEDFDRIHFVVSSIMGANNYSKELLLNESKPSQTLLVLSKKLKGPIIHPVFLD